MKTRALVTAAMILLIATAASAASVHDLTLGTDGKVYRLLPFQDELALSVTSSTHSFKIIPVPDTYGIAASKPQLAFDGAGNTLVLVWQEKSYWSQIMLATYHDGRWFGPIAIAGTPGGPVSNPALLVEQVSSVAEDGTTVSTTLVHVAWWVTSTDTTSSFAAYANVALDADGIPDLETLDTRPLTGDLGVGVVCGAAMQNGALAQPVLFPYGPDGTPHVMFFDPSSCSLHIVELDAVLADDPDATSQRRRHVIVFGVRNDLGLPVELLPASTQYEVGVELSVIGYWDVDDGIEYLQLGENGWSEARVLPLGNGISHEQGVELLRKLVQ